MQGHQPMNAAAEPVLRLRGRRAQSSGIRGASIVEALRWPTSHHFHYTLNELEADREFAGGEFDVAFCFRISMYSVLQRLMALGLVRCHRVFVDFDDVESTAITRQVQLDWRKIGFETTIARLVTALRTRMHESSILRHAHGVSVCSELDRRRLAKRGATAPVSVVPNVYAAADVLPARPADGLTRILFVGTLSYRPNEDGILFFVREVLPLIQRTIGPERWSKVSIAVVGRTPGPELVELLSSVSGVEVHENVPSVAPFYASADFVIAPIRMGGGTRVKILEALALGRAVISTTLGAEGLDLAAGQDLLIADSPEAFSAACIELIDDDARRERIATHGRATFLALYSPEAATRAIREALTTIGATVA